MALKAMRASFQCKQVDRSLRPFIDFGAQLPKCARNYYHFFSLLPSFPTSAPLHALSLQCRVANRRRAVGLTSLPFLACLPLSFSISSSTYHVATPTPPPSPVIATFPLNKRGFNRQKRCREVLSRAVSQRPSNRAKPSQAKPVLRK